MARRKIGELLVDSGVITSETLQLALDEQRRWGGPLGRVMVDRGLLTEDALVTALGQQFRIPVADLQTLSVPQEVLDLIPPDLAFEHGVIPVRVERKSLDLAMSDPTDLGVVDEIQMRTQLDVNPVLAGPRGIEAAIRRLYPSAQRRTTSVMPVVTPAQGAGSTTPAVGVPTPIPPGNSSSVTHVTRPSSARIASSPAMALPAGADEREREFRALQRRVQTLEGLLQRDEDVIRQLCLLLIEKDLVSRDEITKRLSR